VASYIVLGLDEEEFSIAGAARFFGGRPSCWTCFTPKIIFAQNKLYFALAKLPRIYHTTTVKQKIEFS
jgi:hypothetical protein